MTVPGIGPIISSAVVAAIGSGADFKQGRDTVCLIVNMSIILSAQDRLVIEADVAGSIHHPTKGLAFYLW